MLIKCYRLWSNDIEELDRLALYVQRVDGWFSPGICWVDYYVPESVEAMFQLMSDRLELRREQAWIA